jgi:hypothetical protein
MTILVGRTAPDFTAAAVLEDGKIVNNFNLHETIKNQYAIVFFYPLDFTFVCPSELIALDNRAKPTLLVFLLIPNSPITHGATPLLIMAVSARYVTRSSLT